MANSYVLVRVCKHHATASLHWYRWTALVAQWMTGFVPDLTGIRYTYILSIADWMKEIQETREHIEQWNRMVRKAKKSSELGAKDGGEAT